jgi:hypothetical protein
MICTSNERGKHFKYFGWKKNLKKRIFKQFFIMRKKTFFDNESLCLRKTGSGYRIFSATTFFDRKGLNAGSHQFSEKLRSI